jgi:hypothetical protein
MAKVTTDEADADAGSDRDAGFRRLFRNATSSKPPVSRRRYELRYEFL